MFIVVGNEGEIVLYEIFRLLLFLFRVSYGLLKEDSYLFSE